MKRTEEDFDNVVRELKKGVSVSALISSGKFSHLGKSKQTPKSFIASCNSAWRAISEAKNPGKIKNYKKGDCYNAAIALLNGKAPDKKLDNSARNYTQNVFNALERINKKNHKKESKNNDIKKSGHRPLVEDKEKKRDQLQIELFNDIEKIKSNDSLSETEKETLINSRIGQGDFRKNVIQVWGLEEVCPVTKVSIREILIASHIRPWKDCKSKTERLDGANGILLCSHLDKLFDKHLISFKKIDGQYIGQIATHIDTTQLKRIGIENEFSLDISNINKDNQGKLDLYLLEHYNFFFRTK